MFRYVIYLHVFCGNNTDKRVNVIIICIWSITIQIFHICTCIKLYYTLIYVDITNITYDNVFDLITIQIFYIHILNYTIH